MSVCGYLCAALHDVAKLCAKEETSMDNIVDQEMAVSLLCLL